MHMPLYRRHPIASILLALTLVVGAAAVLPSSNVDAATTIHRFNFQPASSPTPGGFVPESGAAFSALQGYGWTQYNGSGTASAMDHATFRRNGGANPRTDTGIDMTPTGRSWGRFEVAVIPGRYRFWVTLGDAATSSSRQRLTVEDTEVIDWTQSSKNRTKTFEVVVDVTDGLLTLHPTARANTALLAMTLQLLDPTDDLPVTTLPTTPAVPDVPEVPDLPDAPDVPTIPDPPVPPELPEIILTSPDAPTFEEPPPLPAINIAQAVAELGLRPLDGDGSLPPLENPVDLDLSVGGIAGIAPGAHFPYMHIQNIDREMELMELSGARYLRLPFTWIAMEPQKGRYNFSKLEVVARMAHEHGIEILANVAYSPKWARPYGCTIHSCAPDDNADYVRFLDALMDHFIPLGVDNYEIWNEPNMALFWSPKPNIAQYADLLKQSYRMAKVDHPTSFILAGSTSPAGDLKNGNQINPITFLNGLMDEGIAGHFDAYSHHPYSYPAAPDATAPWHGLTSVMPQLADILAENGDGAKDIWATEFSYHTATNGGGVSEAKQAEYVGRSFEQWQKVSDGPLIWFNVRNRGTHPDDREQNFGLMTKDWKPKPAWDAWIETLAKPQN